MASGYTRQSSGLIINGAVIQDTHFNNEYNTLEDAFDEITGHNHDGTVGGGSSINIVSSTTGTLTVARGGTGIASYAVGDLIYASGATTLSKLADVATGNALISGGLITAPSWGKIGLTTHVSGTLPETSGGTNQTSFSTGDLLQATASNTLGKLASVATGNALISGGITTASSWGKIGLTTHVSGTLPPANGGTGVANNAASTITITGAFGTTLTVSGTTSLTLPTSGTVTALGNTTTGSGNIVLSTSPTLVTPTLGAATATTINKLTISTPATAATLTIVNNKTFTVNNTITLAGTDAQTYTFPAATDTVACLGTQQSFTKQQNFGASAITSSGASIAWNLQTAQFATHTFTENTTLAAPTNMINGGTYVLVLTQHASSPKTLAYNAVFKWPGGTSFTVSNTNSAVDVLTFVSDGTNMYGVGQAKFS